MITTYNQAKRLKELGIKPTEISMLYNRKGNLYTHDNGWNYHDDCINKLKVSDYPAYPISEALQLIREEYQSKGLYFSVRHGRDRKPYYYGEFEDLIHSKGIMTKTCDTYPDAEYLLLEDVLTYLEQKR